MDNNLEMNMRLTLAVKALEHQSIAAMGFEDLKSLFDWVMAPSRQTIIKANTVFGEKA